MRRKISYPRFVVYIVLMFAMAYSVYTGKDIAEYSTFEIVLKSLISIIILWAIINDVLILIKNYRRK